MLVAFDTETTGFTHSHLVELAAKIIMNNGETYTWYSLCKPSTPIEEGAQAVHGISNAQVENERKDTDVVNEWLTDILKLKKDSKELMVLSGHNIAYDMRVIRKYSTALDSELTLCTVGLGREHSPEATNHKLVTLFNHLGLTGDYKAHSALDDVLMHCDILSHYCQKLGITYQALARAQAKPKMLTTMPFGKHKGTPIKDIPVSYARYMLTLDLDKDLAATLTARINSR